MISTICVECGTEYPSARQALGYHTCLECGDLEAIEEIIRKSTCVAPAYNKGPYVYISSSQDAKDAGK